MKFKRFIATGLTVAATCLGVAAASPSALADVTVNITATVAGTSTNSLTNGVLTIYSTVVAKHHTKTIEYYQHDGYSKTENLVSSSRPIGVVLKEEDIENACDSSTTDGSVNPVGGYEIHCGGVLVNSPTSYRLGGDLIGRFCRVPQAPFNKPCPFPIHVNENAIGSGQYLQVGNKDHGAMYKIDYYTNVTGTDYHVIINIPYGGLIPHGVLLTRIVILPQAAGAAPSAVVTLH